jgi:hypothetical protein
MEEKAIQVQVKTMEKEQRRGAKKTADCPHAHGSCLAGGIRMTTLHHLEDFGLDPRKRRQALRFYQERFDVPDE